MGGVVEQEDGSSASVEKKETNMDNDTKKILLMIARALQVSALAQLANVGVYGGDGVALQTNSLAQAATAHRFDVWRKDVNKERVIAAALFAKIENEEKEREAHEKHMDEIRMDETWRKDRRRGFLGHTLGRKPDETEKNNV